jgi:hypothetical protein
MIVPEPVKLGRPRGLSIAVGIQSGESPNLASGRSDRVKPVGCATPQVDAGLNRDYN